MVRSLDLNRPGTYQSVIARISCITFSFSCLLLFPSISFSLLAFFLPSLSSSYPFILRWLLLLCAAVFIHGVFSSFLVAYCLLIQLIEFERSKSTAVVYPQQANTIVGTSPLASTEVLTNSGCSGIMFLLFFFSCKNHSFYCSIAIVSQAPFYLFEWYSVLVLCVAILFVFPSLSLFSNLM